MYKYSMIMDGEKLTTLFLDHFEADKFMQEMEEYDNSEIVVLGYKEISPKEALNDNELNYSLVCEIVMDYLGFDYSNLKSWELEDALKENFPYLFL